MEWSKDTVRFFLRLIKERPIIWDPHEVKNKRIRNDALEEIALLMGCSTKMVNTKWISLKSQYSREKKRIIKGIGLDANNTPKWFAFTEMESLVKSDASQQSHDNSNDYESSEESTSVSSPPPNKLQRPSTPHPHTRHPSMVRSTPSISSAAKRKKLLYRNSIYKEAMETLKLIRERRNETMNNTSSSRDKDDLTSYGMYVAAHLKKYKPHLQCKARYEINKILYKLDMQSLKNNASNSNTGAEYLYSPDSNENDLELCEEIIIPNIKHDATLEASILSNEN